MKTTAALGAAASFALLIQGSQTGFPPNWPALFADHAPAAPQPVAHAPQKTPHDPQRVAEAASGLPGLTAPAPAKPAPAPFLTAQAPNASGASSPASTSSGAAPAPRTQGSAPAASASAASADAAAQPEIDLTALRYFAQQGDMRRVEAEIARLRALYPNWRPPENPLEVQPVGDPELDRIWKLYSEGRYAEAREAIAARQESEAGWQPPQDLLTRLDLAESRARLVNASNLQQFDTVVRLATDNPSLLTCSDVDVLWRLARAFVGTDRAERGRDAYLYILTNCDNTGERLATIQMASQFLPRADLDPLLATERKTQQGVGEFQAVRDDLARRSFATAANDASVTVLPSDLETMRALAGPNGKPSDLELLGWYSLRRGDLADALDLFGRARAKEDSQSISQGYALSLIPLGRYGEAEEAVASWRDKSDGARAVYLAAAANLLASLSGQPVDPAVLARIVPAVGAARDAASAQQLGWYAYALNQFPTAAQWFETALGWKPADEQSAYGLALVRQRVGDRAGLAALQRQWGGRSPRIAAIGRPDQAEVAAAQAARERSGGPPPALVAGAAPMVAGMATPAGTAAPSAMPPGTMQMGTTPSNMMPMGTAPTMVAPSVAPSPAPASTAYAAAPSLAAPLPVQAMAPNDAAPAMAMVAPVEAEPVQRVRAPVRRAAEPAATVVSAAPAARGRAGRCAQTGRDPGTLAPDAAMAQGWCLLDLDRSLEAAAYFESAARRGEGQTRQDAAYGESLAYLRIGVSDRAAVAASRAPQPARRRTELDVAILSARATSAYEARRPVETLQALDERARLAPERLDLMVLRGYAYLELRRFGDAERVFSAVSRTGNREGARGLEAVRQALGQYPNGG
ncbi:cellulose synthase [Aureimonas ureilytica]|uniref:cellulose synthase n=1 Tax=Aureimonas ureilytica TaxID=401562 RepID=UPI003CE677F5